MGENPPGAIPVEDMARRRRPTETPPKTIKPTSAAKDLKFRSEFAAGRRRQPEGVWQMCQRLQTLHIKIGGRGNYVRAEAYPKR